MKLFLRTYFITWWKPILTLIVFLIFTIVGLLNGSRLIFKIYPYYTAVICISILISFFKVLFTKKWYLAIVQLVTGIIIIFIFFIMFYPRDILFSHLAIPNNIDYKIPLELQTKNSVDSILNLKISKRKFSIANYGQPGQYKSFVFINPKENGSVFLKAFDAVGNIELSEDRLKKRTKLTVKKGEPRIYSQEFTIYDGIWGSKYVARFELWFSSYDKQKEYKIDEEFYLIEGWIR